MLQKYQQDIIDKILSQQGRNVKLHYQSQFFYETIDQHDGKYYGLQAIYEQFGGGTNKLLFKVAVDQQDPGRLKGEKDVLATIVLNDINNKAHGQPLNRAKPVVALAYLNSKILNNEIKSEQDLKLVIQKIRGYVFQYNGEIDKEVFNKALEKIESKVKKLISGEDRLENYLGEDKNKWFRVPKVFDMGVVLGDVNSTDAPNSYYLCENIEDKVDKFLKPDDQGNFSVEDAYAQAFKYASFNQFMNEFYGKEIYEQFTGTHNPYSMHHIKDGYEKILENPYSVQSLAIGQYMVSSGEDYNNIYNDMEKIANGDIPFNSFLGHVDDSELSELGRQHINKQIAKANYLLELEKEMENASPKLSKGHCHGDPWHDNCLGKYIIDKEEAGTGFAIMDVAMQITNKNGFSIDGELNDVGKSIIQASKERGFINDKDMEYLYPALAMAAFTIENMRDDKFASGIYHKRSPLEQGLNCELFLKKYIGEAALDKKGITSRYMTFENHKPAISLEKGLVH